jgi:GT2 family glycosyltransferase
MEAASPTFSAVILTGRATGILKGCVEAIESLDVPSGSLEILAARSGSSGCENSGGPEALEGVRGLVFDSDRGDGDVLNQTVRKAAGEYILLLREDTRVDRDWLKILLDALSEDTNRVCAFGRILSMDRKSFDPGPGPSSPFGLDSQGRSPSRFLPETEASRHALSPNIAACLYRKSFFLDIGGFDSDYPGLAHGLDLGWRTWLAGGEVWFVPKGIATSTFAGEAREWSLERRIFNREFTALCTMFKNYGEDRLWRALCSAILLLLGRGFEDFRLNLEEFDYRRARKTLHSRSASARSAAVWLALREFSRQLPKLVEKRRTVQAGRKRGDEEIAHLLETPGIPHVSESGYDKLLTDIVRLFDIRSSFPSAKENPKS